MCGWRIIPADILAGETGLSTSEILGLLDALGHSTKYSYDKLGQMTKMEQYRTIDETLADLKQISDSAFPVPICPA